MMEVYYAAIEELEDEALAQRLLLKLPKDRRERILCCHKQVDMQRSLAAWTLFYYGWERLSHVKEAPFLGYNAHGKPYVEGNPWYFNLSHAGNYAVAAFADAPVGVDIEQMGRAKAAVAKRFFTEEEQEMLAGSLDEPEEWQRRFAWIWTRKESYIKAVGEGMRIPLDSFCVLLDGDKEGYCYQSIPVPEGFYTSVCCQKKEPLNVAEVKLCDI